MTTSASVIQQLERSAALKPDGAGRYRGNSPLRPDSDSKSFTLTITDAEHGAWKDHVTGESGSLYELAAKIGITTPMNGNGAKPIDKTGLDAVPDDPPSVIINPPKVYPTFATLAEYATHQGVPEEVFRKAGVYELQYQRKGDAAKTLHFAFPCSDKILRLRRAVGGLKPKWFPQATGALPTLYGWQRALGICKGENSPLVLTNGQPSVIVAQHYGIAAFCLTDGENKEIPDAALTTIITQLKTGIELYICKDGDKAGREGALTNYKQLYQYKPTVIDFPGDSGFDLANHCKQHQDNALAELPKYTKHITFDVQQHQLEEVTKALNQLTRIATTQDNNTALQIQLERAQAQIEVLSSQQSQLEFVSNPGEGAYHTFQERIKNPTAITGLKSGHKQLDFAISGFNAGASHAVLGDTGSGKTQLVATWARSMITESSGLVASFECGNNEFVNRMVAAECRLPFGALAKGGEVSQNAHGIYTFKRFTPDQIDRARVAYGNIQAFDRMDRIKFLKPSSYSPRHLLMAAKAAKERYNIQWMIIDSLNNVLTPGRSQQESMALAAIFAETIAQQCNIAVIVTAQGGRSTKERSDKRLGLHDGKWSSEIEEKSSVHMSLYNHWLLVERGAIEDSDASEFYPKGTVQLRINKARHSGMGTSKITLEYVGGCGFYNYQQ